jgi:hypothetical protein
MWQCGASAARAVAPCGPHVGGARPTRARGLSWEGTLTAWPERICDVSLVEPSTFSILAKGQRFDPSQNACKDRPSESYPGRPSPPVRNQSPATQTHNPTDDAKKTCKCRPSWKRLKGFEPSTFCMASRTWHDPDCADIPANKGVSPSRVAADNPRFSPRNHGGLGTESGLSDGPKGSASPRQLV